MVKEYTEIVLEARRLYKENKSAEAKQMLQTAGYKAGVVSFFDIQHTHSSIVTDLTFSSLLCTSWRLRNLHSSSALLYVGCI